MKKFFLNFILRLIILFVILGLFNPIHKNEFMRSALFVSTLTFIMSIDEFLRYKAILKKQSDNKGSIANTSFNISKDKMTFLNNYTLINESNNQLIFLSYPNIILNSYFLVIKVKSISDTNNEIQIRSYSSLKNPSSKHYLNNI